jgi:hypothetical protein
MLQLDSGNVYAPSERDVSYILCCSQIDAVAVFTPSGNVHAFCLADSHMPHSPYMCLALTFCHILQYSLRIGYIACRFICFAIIVFYLYDMWSPIFTLSSTMPSVVCILCLSIIGLRCFLLLICIRMSAVVSQQR